jgi:hypothetical protein
MPNHENAQHKPLDTRIIAPTVPKCCLVCHTAMRSGAKFCPQCGRKLAPDTCTQTRPVTPRGDPSISDIPKEPPAGEKTIQPDQQSRESAVPTPVEPDQPKDNKGLIHCQCGQDLPSGAQFCHQCGAPIRSAKLLSRLVCIDKRSVAQVSEIGDRAIIMGKSPECDLIICDDDYVSRHHARIVPKGQSFLLEDLNSSNGTYLRVQGQISIKNGDEFLIGAHLVRFEQVQGG